jgi:hypothetical protein
MRRWPRACARGHRGRGSACLAPTRTCRRTATASDRREETAVQRQRSAATRSAQAPRTRWHRPTRRLAGCLFSHHRLHRYERDSGCGLCGPRVCLQLHQHQLSALPKWRVQSRKVAEAEYCNSNSSKEQGNRTATAISTTATHWMAKSTSRAAETSESAGSTAMPRCGRRHRRRRDDATDRHARGGRARRRHGAAGSASGRLHSQRRRRSPHRPPATAAGPSTRRRRRWRREHACVSTVVSGPRAAAGGGSRR